MQTRLSTTAIPLPAMPKSAKPRLLRWFKRGLISLLVIIAVLSIIGALYQLRADAHIARAFPPPGRLVDVGGYKLHIFCKGPEKSGNSTVILDHVGAANAAQWGLVQPEIAKITQVCAYDRAGFGWSEAGLAPRDAQQSMNELHTLLGKAGIPSPYILVGHSFGANVARLYVAAYPAEVVGMVLVDPGLQFDIPGVPEKVNAAWKAADQTVMRLAPYFSRLGILRLAATLGASPGHGDLPAPSAAAFDALNLTTKFWDTLSAQNEGMAATSAEVLATPKNLGALPLIVLSPTLPADAGRQEWTKLNIALAARSANGRHRVVNQATHMSLALDRVYAQVTSAAILEVVMAVRTGQPWAQ